MFSFSMESAWFWVEFDKKTKWYGLDISKVQHFLPEKCEYLLIICHLTNYFRVSNKRRVANRRRLGNFGQNQ